MSEQINPGDGWRLLGPDEVTKQDDEVWVHANQRWELVHQVLIGCPAKDFHAVRRRIPAKPEAMEIDGHQVSLDSGFVRIGSFFRHYYFSSRTEAIRKLGEWCIAVADWREAQDAGK